MTFARAVTILVLIIVCLGTLAVPFLVDARHWWPRRSKK